MLSLYCIVLIYSFFRSVRGVFRTYKSLNWIIKNSNRFPSNKIPKNNLKLFFLIPVLREQEIISQTFEVFSKLRGKYKVIFITSQKENVEKKRQLILLKRKRLLISQSKSLEEFSDLTHGIFPRSISSNLYGKSWNKILDNFKKLPSTETMIKRLVAKSPKVIRNKILIYRYPKSEGNMGDQLNYALKKLYKKTNPKFTYTAIYNADSVVSKDLPVYLNNYINKNKKALVIQQSALFLSNFNFFENTPIGSFLKSIALLQSRWTLAHELPRIFNQLKSRLEGAHVVGHGLIINLMTMNEVGYFPTNFINEDLPLGYILKLKGFDIYPLPQLENAQSPTSIRSMFTQYTTWFYGAFHYPSYIKYAFDNFKNKKLLSIIWGVKYFIRSILWLFLSMAWIYLFLYPILIGNIFLSLISISVFIMYSALCSYLIERELNRHGRAIFGKNDFSKIEIDWQTYLMAIPVYLTHSLGPLIATFNTFKSILLNIPINKMKTER